MTYNVSNDAEAGQDYGIAKNIDFSERSIRHGFIRKVYSILMVQFLFNIGIVFAFQMYEETIEPYIFPLLIGSSIVYLAVVFPLICIKKLRYKTPVNFILLFIVTASVGVMLGLVSVMVSKEKFLFAFGITAVVTLAVTIFAFQTKWDFTGMSSVLFVLLIMLLTLGIFTCIWPSKLMHIIHGGFGALLMTFFLIYDTQMMMGGNHKESISPEDYIGAVLSLYLDIINMFLYILEMMR